MRVQVWYWFLTLMQFYHRFFKVHPKQLPETVRVVKIYNHEQKPVEGVFIRPGVDHDEESDDEGQEALVDLETLRAQDEMFRSLGDCKVYVETEWIGTYETVHLHPGNEYSGKAAVHVWNRESQKLLEDRAPDRTVPYHLP